MAYAPPVRWQRRPPAEPVAETGAETWRTAEPLRTTFGPPPLSGGAAALARELLGRDAWLASAGRVAVDAPAPPSGRVDGVVTPLPRQRRGPKAAVAAPRPRGAAARSGAKGLPPAAVRRVTTLGPVPRRRVPAPPLVALDLPAGVVPTWEVRVSEPPPPEPASNSLLQAPEEPARRVVRRVGLGAPLALAPPRPAPPAEDSAPVPASNRLSQAAEEPAPVRTFPRRRLAAHVESVPDDVRRVVESATGIELGDVAVHRSPETAQVARALRAQAFTVGGEVHLPAEHGPLSDPRVRALLAHELVHVAQQRRLGAALPPEDSAYGRLLEEEALAFERTWVAPQTLDAMPAAPAGVQRRLEEPLAPQPAPAPQPGRRNPLADLEDAEIQELAARMYAPIRTRLRRELLVDRERAALLTDGRR